MAPPDDSNPFESTEAYYADHRPGYPDAAIDRLVAKFDLDDASRVLDLGCGAGQLAVTLAARVGEVVGMDPNEEMLRQADRRARDAGRENVEWVVGSDADLREELGPFDLTTMGRSFHWMDGPATLERLYSMTAPGGGVALLADEEWLTHGAQDWQADVREVVERYLGDLRSDGADDANADDDSADEDESEKRWADLLAESRFTDVETEVLEFEREWDVDSVVGYVFSLSFCSPATFGEDAEAFERDLRRRLHERDDAPFVQHVELEILTART